MITTMHRHVRTLQIVLLVILLGSAGIAARGRQAPAARDFSQWEKDVAAFEAADRTNPPPKDAILFVGSSTIVRWTTLQEDFPNQRVINRGFGGNQIVDSTHFADRMIVPYRPRRIFLRAGGNDLHAGKSPEQVFQDFKDFVATIHAKLPDTEIVYISLAPSIARWEEREATKKLNALVEDYVKKGRRLKYIETYDTTLDAKGQPRPELFVEDKLHFSPEGYKLLIERVRPFVK
ncbi:MAG TPA: GDSL-type esterase/lipase family protein [Vicinamibacterales bacterium]|nr:GDSL-type esterase/lipase family protein [Vicinamibacterales bacterium]